MGNHFIKYVLSITTVVTMVTLLSCAQKPGALSPSDIKFPDGFKPNSGEKAIWLATGNQSGGKLLRLDLETGALEKNHLPIGSDVEIQTDSANQIFMLTRFHQDSVAVLDGKNGDLKYYRMLEENSNPQYASRDPMGRVWVTAQQKNTVSVLSPDLKNEIDQIDLSDLKDNDGFAELAQVLPLGNSQMMVLAQRLHRENSHWAPNDKAGMALINIDDLKSRPTLQDLDLSNPVAAYSNGESFLIVGSGDLGPSPAKNAPKAGMLASKKIDPSTESIKTPQSYPYSIVAAHITNIDSPVAMITYRSEENKYCVNWNEKDLYCDTGNYPFHKILKIGNALFVAYVKDGNAGLWIFSLDGKSLVKNSLELPIQSMCKGP